MGFFSSIGKVSGMLGGAESASSSGSSQSGFALLPPELQKAFTQYGSQVSNLFANPNTSAQMFTPMQQTADETAAFDQARAGLGTEQTFNKNISMLMNPFDEFVINDINREATGNNSLVNQAATQAGQQGSNRSFLGTSDVERTRLNDIGQFRQNQYNTAVNQALGPLAGLQQQDITNLLGIGGFQRGLDLQTKQAPFAALQGYGGLLGALPQSGGSTSTQQSESQGESGGLGGLVKTAGTVASLASSLFSDKRLKMDIEPIDEKNGYQRYKFRYIHEKMEGKDRQYIGVMAQDVMQIDPMAVKMDEESGYYKVDYNKIGFPMEEVA